MSDRGFIRKMLFLNGGLLIWALHFAFVYGFNTVACARGLSGALVMGIGMVPLVIGAGTVLALAGTLAILVSAGLPAMRKAPQGDSDRFLSYAAGIVAALSLVAIAWNALPAFVVRPC